MIRTKSLFPFVVSLSSLCVQCFVVVAGFDGFMDSVYFVIKWPGKEGDPFGTTAQDLGHSESVVMTTSNKETYRCILPSDIAANERFTDDSSSNLIELDFLKPLFDQSTCTYRLETYWTYELCYGRHLRQYHEEKETGKDPKLQEYFLGHYKMETFHAEYEIAKQAQVKRDQKKSDMNGRIQKVQGIEVPYYEVVFTDGTACDLNGKPRRAFLRFVCEPSGQGEIYELKETSSCEYEVVVLSSQLCAHPNYGPKKEPSNTINCHLLGDSPERPRNLELLEQESTLAQFNSRQNNLHHDLLFDPVSKYSSPKTGPPREPRVQGHPTQHPPPAGNQILKEFLDGSFCIEGGTGWWKHKFCYGRQVAQFHIDDLHREVVVLGDWNEENHLKWIHANPSKRPKPLAERSQISLFYSNGDVCDVTGQPRTVEVKFRCILNPVHPNAISISLNEPRVCEYTLVVQSSVLCDLVVLADDNGLIERPEL